ncbi:MAG TPA: hypothetical protein VGO70_05115 [Arsenicitalea sp.]|jgi:hypothetical protein|nr:hypothetical protein [Arsenicitalea sp.]
MNLLKMLGSARRLLITASVVVACLAALPVRAETVHDIDPLDNAVFVFGGRFHSQYFQWGFVPMFATYENNFLLGAGYQHFFLSGNNVRIGGEVGAALRFGDSTSQEVWAGIVGRYDGFVLGNVRVSPAFTFGLSYETGTVGIEGTRQAMYGGDPTILFYMGPELNLSWADNPNFEVFWRIQHRSGAWGTVGNFSDGANATTVGLRWHF